MAFNEDKRMNREDKDLNRNLNRQHNQIGRLGDFDDYEVADDDPDVRGWDVIGADGTKYGEVEDLIVDPQAMKVRYLEVQLTDDLAPEDEERHLLVPIGMASLDDDNDRVYLGDLDRATLAQIPAYDGSPITREYEHALRTAFRTDQVDATSRATVTPPPDTADLTVPPAALTNAPLSEDKSPVDGTLNPKPVAPQEKGNPSDDFYSHKSYDQDAFYRNRRKPGRSDM
jgi:photosynthetic reaction center H subunit